MKMAAEAIQDSERIFIGRQRLDNIADINIDGIHESQQNNPLK